MADRSQQAVKRLPSAMQMTTRVIESHLFYSLTRTRWSMSDTNTRRNRCKGKILTTPTLSTANKWVPVGSSTLEPQDMPLFCLVSLAARHTPSPTTPCSNQWARIHWVSSVVASLPTSFPRLEVRIQKWTIASYGRQPTQTIALATSQMSRRCVAVSSQQHHSQRMASSSPRVMFSLHSNAHDRQRISITTRDSTGVKLT